MFSSRIYQVLRCVNNAVSLLSMQSNRVRRSSRFPLNAHTQPKRATTTGARKARVRGSRSPNDLIYHS